MTRREYRGNAQATTITANLDIGDYTIYASSLAGNDDWPDGSIGPFFVVVNRGKNNEEKILCESRTDGTILVVNPGGRGADETPEGSHTVNSSIEHVFTATDADESNAHIYAPVISTTNVHGITDTADLLVMDDPRLGTAAYEDVPFTAGNIAENAVTTVKILASAVTTAKIADDAVTIAKIADNAVDTAQIVAGAVETAKIEDLAVTAAKIAANAVTTAKILNENVTTAKIEDLAVTTAKIADDSVTTAKIPDDAITTALIVDGAVTSAKIATGTIVNADVNASAAIEQSKISGLVTDLDNRVLSASGVNNRILASGTSEATIPINTSTVNVDVNYSGAGFTSGPDICCSTFETSLRVVGVLSRNSDEATLQIRNLAGNVPSATVVKFFWIATGT